MVPAALHHDYYLVLETQPSANYNEIKKCFFRLARVHHPDKNGGAQSATAKFQLINAAWETLRDDSKRREYDVNYFRPSASSNSSTKSTTSKTDSDDQKPGMSEEQRNRESSRKRQEWLNWEKAQDDRIVATKSLIHTMEAEISKLDLQDIEDKAKISTVEPYWWNIFAPRKPPLSDEEKDALRREILQRNVARTMKLMVLEQTRGHLQRLENEKARRLAAETERLRNERCEQEREEKLAREKAQAERYRAWEEQLRRDREWAEVERKARLEKERLERIAREKAEAERKARLQKAEAERRERVERERVERIERERQEAERRRIVLEELKLHAEKLAREREARERRLGEQVKRAVNRETVGKDKKPRGGKKPAKARNIKKDPWRDSSTSACTHKGYWDKVNGRQCCNNCSRMQNLYAYSCPGCGTIACASCRRNLKGGKPGANRSDDTRYEENVDNYYDYYD